MRLRDYILRSMRFHWRTHAAVALGVVVGVATLTGALLVGDSMRGSLRDAALDRLGRADYAVRAARFAREGLAGDLMSSEDFQRRFRRAAALIALTGSAANATTQARANRIGILGVDDSFWQFRRDADQAPARMDGRRVILNEPLARELGVEPGEDVIVTVGKPSAISSETLLGRRDDRTASLRLTVTQIVAADGLGAFSLGLRQEVTRNAFVPLHTLQRALDRRDAANLFLVEALPNKRPTDVAAALRQLVDEQATLGDLGLRLRLEPRFGYVSLEAESMLIDPSVEAAALAAAESLPHTPAPLLTYLANRIERVIHDGSDGRVQDDGVNGSRGNTAGIPYSTVCAIDPTSPAASRLTVAPASAATSLAPGEILLNRWAATDLDASPGDEIALTYFVTGRMGRLETRRTVFRLRGVVALSGDAADSGFTPEYGGVTDAENLAEWDPPFPMDLSAIRDEDEEYWKEYRATPKAFITLAEGKRLWTAREQSGDLTAIRVYATDKAQEPQAAAAVAGASAVDKLAVSFEKELRTRLDAGSVGLAVQPIRAQAAEASEGTTDFGVLFVSFSFFLIVSATMLVALLFRLNVERRAGEVGLLLATGFAPRTVAGLLVAEGAIVALIGAVFGLVTAAGYTWLMVEGLRTSWTDAVNAPFLRVHARPASFAAGFVASLLILWLSIAWSIRGLTRLSPRSLLAGSATSGGSLAANTRRRRISKLVAVVGLLIALVCATFPLFSSGLSPAPAFFLGGSSMLVACLAAYDHHLRRPRPTVVHLPGLVSVARLGMRNARRRPGRSLLSAGLLASSAFLISSMGAFRKDVSSNANDRSAGTGGFALFAESAVPLVHDLNTPDGREALNMKPSAAEWLTGVHAMPLRLRPGDESGCRNLYRPTTPRILGAPEAMIERGGFAFGATLAESEQERKNPWTLLNREFPDGAIPVIGDAAAVVWQFHKNIGEDLAVIDDAGRDVRLRFVALLDGSMLQDELIVAESRFVELYPSIDGYGFFLIDTSSADSALDQIERTLEREFAPYGFDVRLSATRLHEYFAVQNTYLVTFQTLGAFGLILGTVGLSAVLLRNIWERRGELALLRAVGFSLRALAGMVLLENVAVLLAGLLAGVVSALLAIAPHVVSAPHDVPWLRLGLTLLGVVVVGLGSGVLAVIPVLRTPLLPALRSE